MNANIIIYALTCNALNQSDSLPRVDILIGEGFVKTPRVIKAIPDTGAEVSVAGVALLTSLLQPLNLRKIKLYNRFIT